MKNRLFSFLTALGLCLCCVSIASAYSNNDLCNMAKQHYKSLYGQEPPVVQVDREDGDEVVLHLCEITLGHVATWDWYTINRNTGTGTSFMGDAVDLSSYAPGASAGSGLPFTDVKTSDPFYSSIAYVYQNGLFAGTSPTTFSPNGFMNRGMLATVLYRLAGQPAVSGYTGFQDVESGAYYEGAVTWASARGIVNGTSNAAFSPQNLITREQMAVLLYRYAVLYLGMDSACTAPLGSYPDGAQVGAYAKKAVQWCAAKGLISGSKLSPQSSATRAEVAVMLHRLSQLSEGAGGYKRALESFLGNGGVYNNYNSSVYYDIDGDGMEELLSIYTAAGGKQQRAAVYTLQNGTAVRLMDEEVFDIAGAPLGELGAIELGGATYLCIHAQNYSSDIDTQHNGKFSGFYRIYSLYHGKLILAQEVRYSLTGRGDLTPSLKGFSGNVSIEKNGQTQVFDMAGFQAWLNAWSWKSKAAV